MNTNPRASDEEFVYFGGVIASIVDLGTQRGLEIGPFDRPFFTKEQTDVKFLDYRTTAELRAFASVSPGHSPHFVDELDYVVPGSGDWSEIPDGSFDWVLSAHALERSPNLIGVLKNHDGQRSACCKSTVGGPMTVGMNALVTARDCRRLACEKRPCLQK